MEPVAITIVLSAVFVFFLSKLTTPVRSTPVLPPPNSALGFGMPEEGSSAVLPISGVQSLTGPEKVALFTDLKRRWVIDKGKVEGAEVMEFVDKDKLQRTPSKAGEAMDVLYGANMGIGLNPHAILVSKTPEGKTSILAVSDDNWIARARVGSPWNVFLRPGEGREVAKAAGVNVVEKLPAASGPLLLPAATMTSPVDGTEMKEGPPVIIQLVSSPDDLVSVLPSAGFGGSALEAIATTPAAFLPAPWQSVGSAYATADELHGKGDIDIARTYAAPLGSVVVPLRNAGYALASAQVQTLLTKVGAAA
jgi:hypothetical protein